MQAGALHSEHWIKSRDPSPTISSTFHDETKEGEEWSIIENLLGYTGREGGVLAGGASASVGGEY